MSAYDTADMAVFFSDFADTVSAATWGASIPGLFNNEYVEYDGVSGVSPSVLIQTADVSTTADSGDLFTVLGINYKLVNIEETEPGITRIVLAAV